MTQVMMILSCAYLHVLGLFEFNVTSLLRLLIDLYASSLRLLICMTREYPASYAFCNWISANKLQCVREKTATLRVSW